MAPDRKLLELLADTDEAGHVAYTRHLCERLLEEWPDHGTTLIRYASVLIEMAQYNEAAYFLDRAESVVSEGMRHLVVSQRGYRLKRMGDLAGSEEQYMKAHKLHPDWAGYLIFAGVVAFRRGEIPRAEKLIRKALSCPEGSHEEALFNLGNLLVAQRRYEEARNCYRRAIEIDPDYSLARECLADVDHLLASLSI
jgi:tetratricopeptide (TPR) repeat protein